MVKRLIPSASTPEVDGLHMDSSRFRAAFEGRTNRGNRLLVTTHTLCWIAAASETRNPISNSEPFSWLARQSRHQNLHQTSTALGWPGWRAR